MTTDRIIEAIKNQYESKNIEMALHKMLQYSTINKGKADLILDGKKYFVNVDKAFTETEIHAPITHAHAYAQKIGEQLGVL